MFALVLRSDSVCKMFHCASSTGVIITNDLCIMLWNQYMSGACFSGDTHRPRSPLQRFPVAGNQYKTMFALTHVWALTIECRSFLCLWERQGIVHDPLTKLHLYKKMKAMQCKHRETLCKLAPCFVGCDWAFDKQRLWSVMQQYVCECPIWSEWNLQL